MDIPIKFSEGFSPKPKIVNIGALPLGLETYCEVISIELLQKLDLSDSNRSALIEKLNAFLPHGIKIIGIEPLQEKLSKNFPKAMIFKYTPEKFLYSRNFIQRKKLPIVFNHRGVEVDLNEHILDLQIINNAIITKVKCNDQGGSVSPYTIYAGLMQLENDASRLDEVARTFLIQKQRWNGKNILTTKPKTKDSSMKILLMIILFFYQSIRLPTNMMTTLLPKHKNGTSKSWFTSSWN